MPQNIHSKRICFFDKHFLDELRTTADLRLHHPVNHGTVLLLDAPWEGDGCNYGNLFFDQNWHGCDNSCPNGTYRHYYLGWNMLSEDGEKHYTTGVRVCYAESPDGIHWTKPNLGLLEINGSKNNNLILDKTLHPGTIDNFMVFRDDNPACPDQERYKGIGSVRWKTLGYWTSPDGIHFNFASEFPFNGWFDSLNVIFWDNEAKLYRCYFRGFHAKPGEDKPTVRDISYTESTDFKNWTEPTQLEFDDGEDIPLYTNNVAPYFRAPDTYIGFPTRYIERPAWNGTFDELCGREKRLKRMKDQPRYGLTITDCAFIASQDGVHFHRFQDAFMRPESENGLNWVYGDCYPSRGFCVTPAATPGAPDELSMYLFTHHWMSLPSEIQRYTIRMDGFASLHADGRELTAVTKPFTYDGTELRINFETSARGYLFIAIVTEDGRRIESCETFGNAIDRKVVFNEPLPPAGTTVTMEIRLLDADVYSFQFK
ncbi:MAG: hypothetical protein J6X55_13940 [Victivallales bacterium]|nr:hypothetical protein [Victivallales bacterium]